MAKPDWAGHHAECQWMVATANFYCHPRCEVFKAQETNPDAQGTADHKHEHQWNPINGYPGRFRCYGCGRWDHPEDHPITVTADQRDEQQRWRKIPVYCEGTLVREWAIYPEEGEQIAHALTEANVDRILADHEIARIAKEALKRIERAGEYGWTRSEAVLEAREALSRISALEARKEGR